MFECPLCAKSRKVFYCKNCVNYGDYSRSTAPCGERYAEKHLRLLSAKKDKNEVEAKCEKLLESRLLKIRVSNAIEEYKERIKLFKCLIKKSQEGIAHKKTVIAQLKLDNEKSREQTLPVYGEKVRRLRGFVTHHDASVRGRRGRLAGAREDLRRAVRARVHELVELIFPISVVQPAQRSLEGSGSGTASALKEAASLAWVGGGVGWVATDPAGEERHRVVAPTLPASGDYASYAHWAGAAKEGAVATVGLESIARNQEYNIGAALTYTAQLVNVLAFYLDVKLPNKLCYSELCGGPLSEQKFARRVARLNLNVLHLCLSQNVPSELIRPVQTVQNILLLLKSTDLGRVGPVETDPEVARALEDRLRPDPEPASGDDSFSDEDSDPLNLDWEAVPHVTGADAAGAGPGPGPAQTTGAGLVTSAAAGLASIWRGLTANR